MKKILKKISEESYSFDTVIKYLESKGFKFKKDKDDLWQEDYVEEIRLKDLFGMMHFYAISHCDCTEEETTGCISEYVCNNCGRVQR